MDRRGRLAGPVRAAVDTGFLVAAIDDLALAEVLAEVLAGWRARVARLVEIPAYHDDHVTIGDPSAARSISAQTRRQGPRAGPTLRMWLYDWKQ